MSNRHQYLDMIEEDWEYVSLLERSVIMADEEEQYSRLKNIPMLVRGEEENSRRFVKRSNHVRKYINRHHKGINKVTTKSFTNMATGKILSKQRD